MRCAEYGREGGQGSGSDNARRGELEKGGRLVESRGNCFVSGCRVENGGTGERMNGMETR